MIPSEVSQWTYEIKPHLRPIDMRNVRENIIRPDLFQKKDSDLYIPDTIRVDGTPGQSSNFGASVTSSPDVEGGEYFGNF